MKDHEIIIVGAGLSGLAAATQLQKAGRDVLIIEAGDRPGGRVRTDNVDGFLLDRGFQVFFEAYPQGRRYLDYDALNFQYFEPGALVRSNRKFHRMADPLRKPTAIPETLVNPVGNLLDRVKMLNLRARACQGPLQAVFDRHEFTSIERLPPE